MIVECIKLRDCLGRDGGDVVVMVMAAVWLSYIL